MHRSLRFMDIGRVLYCDGDFCWVDEYDVIAGSNWKSRPLVRRKARREDNDTMRRLGDFVKKRVYRSVEM
ncbi:hypothetical protein PHAVU_002G053800 [Phaseolus vulgaris]|uniref:Uncharacterized protein n=1 Tax=Phaseolus vulgaris TaxID=3885 RepID=V7CIX2_PHAVU|nr:hypothetical protein PHAVU_002G053800g [Phaseolus vulgaris]ESW29225.1 hypothetical protein PHAVU_002G053800g [Phaseolus vulgaris]